MLRSHSWSTKTCFFFNLRCEKHEETYPQLISYFKIIYKRWWSTAEINWRNFAPFHTKIEGNTTKTKNILGIFRKETYDFWWFCNSWFLQEKKLQYVSATCYWNVTSNSFWPTNFPLTTLKECLALFDQSEGQLRSTIFAINKIRRTSICHSLVHSNVPYKNWEKFDTLKIITW
jgi:hypothetical protein